MQRIKWYSLKQLSSKLLIFFVTFLTFLCIIPATEPENCPDGLSIIAMDGKVQLSWSHQPLVKKYEILRSNTQEGPFEKIADGSSKYLTFLVTSVFPEQIQYYKIRPLPKPFSDEPCNPVVLAAIPPSGNSQMVYIPDVVGKPLAKAIDLLEQNSLTWDLVQEMPDSQFSANPIRKQDPPPNSHVPQFSVVKLFDSPESPSIVRVESLGKVSNEVVEHVDELQKQLPTRESKRDNFLPSKGSGLVLSIPNDIILDCKSELHQLRKHKATAKDECLVGESSIFFVDKVQQGACPDEQIITRTWVAENECNESTTKNQLITVEDLIPPEIHCPPDQNLMCGTQIQPEITGEPHAIDDCSPHPLIAFTDSEEGSCEHEKSILRTWTATDQCGNFSSCTQRLVMKPPEQFDLICPEDRVVAVDASITPENTGRAIAKESKSLGVQIDYSDTRSKGSCPKEWIITRTWSATNTDGVPSRCLQTIVVLDTNAPEFPDIPAEITAECGKIPAPLSFVPKDNSNFDVTVKYSDTVVGSDICGPGRLKRVLRSWTTEDACGNKSRLDQVIHLTDTTPPVFHGVPKDLVAEVGAIPAPPMVTASDDCEGPTPVEFEEIFVGSNLCSSDSSLENTQKIIRRWIASDSCNNSAVAEQIIIVQDTTPPVFAEIPENIAVECHSIPDPSVVFASDNSGTDVTFDFTETQRGTNVCLDSPSKEHPQKLERIWTASDHCGNRSEIKQTISIVDMTPPKILSKPILEAEVGTRYSYSVQAKDHCSKKLKFSLKILPSGMEINTVSGLITWIPEPDQVGEHKVSLQVKDPCDQVINDDFFITVRIPMVKVPDLRGMEKAEAVLVISALDLTLGEITTLNDPSVPQNTIIDQTPLGGSKIFMGDLVGLTIAANSNSTGTLGLVKKNQSMKEPPPQF